MAKQNSNILKYLAIIILIIVILNVSFFLITQTKINPEKEAKQQETEKSEFKQSAETSFVEMKLPAVDSQGNGVTTSLLIESKKGSGRTLTDIENLLFWADTQQSIRMAKFVAENISQIDAKNYDLIYNIKANASLIGGPSAGAALTIGTIFALQGKQPRNDVVITGTINHDGTIGPVSGILEKAKAAKENGASILLVPLLQSSDIIYETTQHCQKFGFSEVCTTETRPKKINVESEAGIKIAEVASIEEALGYFEKSS